MAEQFTKAGKTAEEVGQVLKYVTQVGRPTTEVKELYDKWAEHYDKDLQFVFYNPPGTLASHVADFYGEVRDLRILDVAAGTGLLGKELYDRGFKKLDALDASEKMLEKARKLGIYNQFYQEYMGKNRLPIADGCYDAVVTTGSFVPGHLNEDCYEELIRITQKGGRIFILMTERYFTDSQEYSCNLEPRMLELQEQGLWKRVLKKTNIQNYYQDQTGVLFVLEKC